MKKFISFSLGLFYFFHSNAQTTNCPPAIGSVNAYYDAIFLSGVHEGSDTCTSLRALKILAAYHSRNAADTFKTGELSRLYSISLTNVFKVDEVIKFYTDAPASKPETLGRDVKKYNELMDSLSNLNRAFDLVSSWNLDSVITDFFLHKQGKLCDTLERSFNDENFKQGLRCDSLEIYNNEIESRKWISDLKFQVLSFYGNKKKAVNRNIAQQKAAIANYSLQHFNDLDPDLKTKITGTILKAEISKINLAVLSARANANVAADSFYYKNETYSLSNFKLPSQTEMIDALAIYLARRFKQEVALTLVDQFRRILKNDLLVTELFPETLKMFSSGKVYEMPSFGSAWNYAISKDFTNLIPNLAQSQYVNKKFGDSTLVKHLKEIVSMGDIISKQFSIVDVVSALHLKNNTTEWFRRNINSLYVINKELFDTASAGRFWISAEQLFSLNEDQFKLFVQLVDEKHTGQSGIIVNLSNDVSNLRNQISSVLVLLNSFQAQQRRYLQMQNSTATVQLADYWGFVNQLFEVLNGDPYLLSPRIKRFIAIENHCFEAYSLLSQKNYAGAALRIIDILPQVTDSNYINLASLVLNTKKINQVDNTIELKKKNELMLLCDNLSDTLRKFYFERKLAHDIDEAKGDNRQILQDDRVVAFRKKWGFENYEVSLLRKEIHDDTGKIRSRLEAMASQLDNKRKQQEYKTYLQPNVQELVTQLIDHSDSDGLQEYLSRSTAGQYNSFRLLSGFLSDMLLAGNSKNLSLVIEKYALPPNSYKIKRASLSSWDLNAYVGPYVGLESLDISANHTPAFVYGFSVPVGISYSWAKIYKDKNTRSYPRDSRYANLKGNSISITASVIDIGAVVSYRLGHTSGGLPRNVSWSQLLAPGLHVRWGVKDTPLCFSVGIQRTPQLRKLQNLDNEVSATRLFTGFFFDLPLYNFSHR